MAQVRLPDGVMLMHFEDLPICREIYFDRVYDRFYRIKEDDVVIDVGAHFGVFTLRAARRARMVVAVEPHPVSYKFLVENLSLNGLKNVIPVNLALLDYNGVAKLYIGERPGLHTTKKKLLRSPKGFIEVGVATLDRLVDELKLDRVDFVKVDVEGAELDVLRGAEKLLEEERRIFLAIACYHSLEERMGVPTYLKSKGLGYSLSVAMCMLLSLVYVRAYRSLANNVDLPL